MQRRSFIQQLSAVFASGLLSAPALAKLDYPQKSIRIIVPTSPGGATDAVARLFAEQAGQRLKQPVVVENVPGAATLIAVRQAVSAKADGYTLSVMANSFTAMPHADSNARYQISQLKGVSYLARSDMFLVVSANSPYRTLEDLVTAARKSPGELNYATVGKGTSSHMPIEMFSQDAKLELTAVPYKGITAAIPDVIAGRIDLMMGTIPSTGMLIKDGKLRVLAAAAPQRMASMPDIPTFTELGYSNVQYDLYLGLMTPAQTPDEVVKLLSDVFENIKTDPNVIKRLSQLDQNLPSHKTPEQFNQFLLQDEKRMRTLLSRYSK